MIIIIIQNIENNFFVIKLNQLMLTHLLASLQSHFSSYGQMLFER